MEEKQSALSQLTTSSMAPSPHLNINAKPFQPTAATKNEEKSNPTRMTSLGHVRGRGQGRRRHGPQRHAADRHTTVSAGSPNHPRSSFDTTKARTTEQASVISMLKEFTESSTRENGSSASNSAPPNHRTRSPRQGQHHRKSLVHRNQQSQAQAPYGNDITPPAENKGEPSDKEPVTISKDVTITSKRNQHMKDASASIAENGLTWDNTNISSNHPNSQFEVQGERPKFKKKTRIQVERKPLNPQNFESHKASLISSLTDGKYECMICYVMVRQEAPTWNCKTCYHVFHLHCVKKWANTSSAESATWTCPSCQSLYVEKPRDYLCFCGKQRDPEWNRSDTPHSCGEMCGGQRAELCTHPCNELCHPGPCTPCTAQVSDFCKCGKSYQTVRCTQRADIRCAQVCNNTRNCTLHRCVEICHPSPCHPCNETITQACHCGQSSRVIICGSLDSNSPTFPCDLRCDKRLSCGNHPCTLMCHVGPCPPCSLEPGKVTTCACGQSDVLSLEGLARTSCLDPLPTCEQVCGKLLRCAERSNKPEAHICTKTCHTDPCTCRLTTLVSCRCGNQKSMVPCRKAIQYFDKPMVCDKRCKKLRECGRHKCGLQCCDLKEHPCTLTCGKTMRCGLHQCQLLCHGLSQCPRCLNASFDELRCHCGTEVIFPPVQCGAKPPVCTRPCNRSHSCDHVVLHPCHNENACPPCATLTDKWCLGRHEIRTNIPCYLTSVSCGKQCYRLLSCGKHRCVTTCHDGECVSVCRQPCREPRPACGHPCLAPCHNGPCRPAKCQQKVNLKCNCGNRSEEALCYMTDRRVECDDKCLVIQRNERWARALDVRDEEPAPDYPDALISITKRDPAFVGMVEKAFKDLIASSDTPASNQTPSHSFAAMKKPKRKFIHELAPFYFLETQSLDSEPNRNVVAYISKGKSAVPGQTLTFVANSSVPSKPAQPHPASKSNVDEFFRGAIPKVTKPNRVNSAPKTKKFDWFETDE